ncbi:MAG TPA: hypothetical protein VIA80_07835, partial [Hyphomonadaceae bacterium]
PSRLRPLLLAASIAAAVILAAGAGWWINLNSKAVDVAVAPVTLAVLPFDALDDDPEITRMAGTVPRDMADAFSRGGISVMATARSMAFGGDAKARAADELGAELLIDGTVKRQGGTAHIAARLYHAERGITLWTTDLTADPGDPFVDERLASVFSRVIYWPAPLRILNSRRPNAVEETRTFLRILEFNYTGDSIQSRQAAHDFARNAPDLSTARTASAIETIHAFPHLSVEERIKELRFARSESEEALRLAPRDGSAYMAAMRVLAPDRWEERIRMMREAIRIDPQYTRIDNNLAEVLLATGASMEALAVAKRARASEPLSAARPVLLANAHLANGEIAQMNSVLDPHLQIWPQDAVAIQLRFYALAWTGKLDEAEAQLPRMFAPGDAGLPHQVLVAMLKAKRSGDARDADQVTRLCTDIGAQDIDTASACLTAGGMLNRPDAAVAGAEITLPRIHDPASDAEDLWIRNRLCCSTDGSAARLFLPWMAPMRADPRIIDVFERIGLVAYWRETGNWPDFCETEPQSVCAQMKSG